jgi:protein-S-isoprenylcysteine O-methyltransferase Ste14
MISRWLPALGLALFFGLAFVWRAWLQWHRHGNTGIILFRSGRGQGLRDSIFVLLLLLLAGQAVLTGTFPDALTPILIVGQPAGALWLLASSGLLFGGTLLVVVAQLDLGASWRVGIDEGARPGLVTEGLYRFCRNPIFSAMFLTLGGLALAQPTWLSAVAVLGALVAVRSQVIEEESYLLANYGDTYRAYARRVGRFVPWLGRIA